MSMQISLKEAERKAFRSTFQDGLWDIYLGFLVLLMGVGPELGGRMEDGTLTIPAILVIILVLACIPMLGFWAAKRYITTPRIGLVEFGPERQAKRKKVTAIFSVSVFVGVVLLLLALFFMNNPPSWVEWGWVLPAGIWGLNAVVVSSLAGYYLDFPRAYLYGWFLALPFPASILLLENFNLPFITSYAVFAGVMILIGAVLLVRFLRRYPMPDMEG